MRKAFVYRLYTNRTKDKALASLLDIARTFYNAALQEKRDAWKCGISLNYYDQADQIKGIRQENPWCTALNFSATQDILRRLDKTFQAFFHRCRDGKNPGYPRFKSRDRFGSITFPSYGDGIRLTDKLYIQNVGKVRINLHRPIEGRIKAVTIKRICGKWYAVFSCDIGEVQPREAPTNPVGIDMGIRTFAALSDGTMIGNPRYFKQGENRLAQRQQRLSSKAKGSHRRRKSRLLVAKAHLKIQRQRLDFHHKVAKELALQYDLIAYEDLDIRQMISDGYIAKSLHDVAWGQFLRIMCYKAEEAGGTVIPVDPQGTTEECSHCGFFVPKDLKILVHACPNCGIVLDRDINAARNILRLGLSLQGTTLRSCLL